MAGMQMSGKAALVEGDGRLASALARALTEAGASIAARAGQTPDILIVLSIVPRAQDSLGNLPMAAYDRLFSATVGRLYATLHDTVPAMQARGGGNVVAVMVADGGADEPLAMSLFDGMEAVVAGFAASYAGAFAPVRVNGVRMAGSLGDEDITQLIETTAMLASGEASYMNGASVNLQPRSAFEVRQ